MRAGRIVARSLRFHWRTHLGVLAATALSAAVLAGALLVGAAVRGALHDLALARLGGTRLALASGERLVQADLAEEVGESLGAPAAAALHVRALVAAEGERAALGGIELYGVDDAFWRLAGRGAEADRDADGAGARGGASDGRGVVLSERLATRLAAEAGDELVFKFERPSHLSREAGLVPAGDRSGILRVRVVGVVADDEGGRFSLRAEQEAPLNAFVPRGQLAAALDAVGRANLVLLGERPDGTAVDVAAAEAALRERWGPEDASVRVRELAGGSVQIDSERVFLDPPIGEAAAALPGAEPMVTYLVNGIWREDAGGGQARAVPYSFVCAAAPERLRSLMPEAPTDAAVADDAIVINEWLATELDAEVGARLRLRYFVLGPSRMLIEREEAFTVAGVVPVASGDRDMTPPMPGLTGRASCADWDSGLPLDLSRIRDADEDYWDAHGTTPKAFVPLATGERLWRNEYGDRTGVRIDGADPVAVADALRRAVDPAAIGLRFEAVGAEALRAANPTVDFGQLFLGLSFFLLAAAVCLTALVFRLGVEQRAGEVGALRAVGFDSARVRRLLVTEAAVVATVGAALGAGLGVAYARALLAGLGSAWRGAIGLGAVPLRLDVGPIAIGSIGAAVVAVLSVRWTLRGLARENPADLLRAGGLRARAHPGGAPRRVVVGSAAATLLGVGVAAFGAGAGSPAGVFFAAGALLLVGGVGLLHAGLDAVTALLGRRRFGARALALRGGAVGGRRLALAATLAAGVFLVATVGMSRRFTPADPTDRGSGTGGFALVVETSVPVLRDLNTEEGLEETLATDEDLSDVSFVALRQGGGDDASCLNLNRVPRPRLYGVNPDAFGAREAFRFARLADGVRPEVPWSALDLVLEEGVVPGIADFDTAMWALGVELGDDIEYPGASGRPVRVRLVGLLDGSMLQGALLVSDSAFRAIEPAVSGHRALLVDAPPERSAEVAAALRRGLRDFGVEVTPAADRLAALLTVQNTYLAVFLTLGGLGLLIGTAGVAAVVLREVLERRCELGVLRAVGFSRARVAGLLLEGNGALVVAAVGVGAVAALVAAWPALQRGAEPLRQVAIGLPVIAASALAWTWLAVRWGTRGDPLAALREEP